MEIVKDWFRGPAVNNMCDSRRGAEINREEIGMMSFLRAIELWEGLRRLRSPSICQKKKNIVIAMSSYLICYFLVCARVDVVCVYVSTYLFMYVYMHVEDRAMSGAYPNHSPSCFFLLSFLFVCFVLF